jgi:hypothetical protein
MVMMIMMIHIQAIFNDRTLGLYLDEMYYSSC